MADQSPLFMLPHAVALENQRQIWADHNQRVRDAHDINHKALAGAVGVDSTPGENETDMGAITVQRDTIHQHYHAAPPAASPAAPAIQTPPNSPTTMPTQPTSTTPNNTTPTTPATPSGTSKWAIPLLCVLAGTGGAGTAVAIYEYFHKPAVVAPDDNWNLGAQVYHNPQD